MNQVGPLGDAAAEASTLNPGVGHVVASANWPTSTDAEPGFPIIAEQWDRIGQFYAAFPAGHATASAALQRLDRFQASNRFYAANRELGRALKLTLPGLPRPRLLTWPLRVGEPPPANGRFRRRRRASARGWRGRHARRPRSHLRRQKRRSRHSVAGRNRPTATIA